MGTTRSTKTPPFCSVSSSSCSQARSTAATQACSPATASGATARCTDSASSSRASSITPTRAARSRDAGALGRVMRCQATSVSPTTAMTCEARRQERRGGVALGLELDAVGAGDVDVLAPPPRIGRSLARDPRAQAPVLGELNHEGRHGRAAETTRILGGRRVEIACNQRLTLLCCSAFAVLLRTFALDGLTSRCRRARRPARAAAPRSATRRRLHQRALLEDDVAEAQPAADLEEVGADRQPVDARVRQRRDQRLGCRRPT